ncbi:MAG: ROK family protein [Verrucomicrobia bacterium]|nr:ROK family protein [Verrucomicrobiota bacterium]MCH8525590.1 ROK family protein [Kiritimatiellia bacterium]
MSAPDHWLGIDLGATKILAEVYTGDWKRVGAKKRKTKADEGQEKGIERLIHTAEDAIADAGIEPKSLAGIGIGCPGPLDLSSGTLISSANLGWTDVPLRKLLTKQFSVPAAVANDVDVGIFGEAVAGAGKGARTVLGVFPGTGLGGGLVYEGRIFHGKTASCLEIGHMNVLPDGPRCGCGRTGCLEAVASRLAIATAASAAVLRGQAPWLKANAGSDPADYRSGTLADSVRNGDTVVQQLVEDACDHLGRALGGLVNLLAPDVIVLGGGLVEAMPDIILPRVQQAMKPRIMKAYADSFTVVPAQLGDHAATLGAAALARQHVEHISCS